MTRVLGSMRACAVLLAAGGVARAEPPQEATAETIYVTDDAPGTALEDRARALGDAPFVTVLRPSDRPSNASVADAIATSAGALASSMGGLGAFQSVSVRGAAPGHTAVLIDGVPLARLAAVTMDLGKYPLDAFGEVRFYRGAVPVELGGAGVGGAIDLVTRLGRGPNGERLSATLGYGSYGARHFRAHYGDEHDWGEKVLSSVTVGYEGATGDYTYFDDNGTLLNQKDDSYKTRANNGFDQVDAAARAASAEHPLGLGMRVAWKRQGLPGSTSAPAPTARLSTFDAIADGNGETRVGGWRGHTLGYALVELQTLSDPNGELGLGAADESYKTISLGLGSTWKHAIGAHQLAGGAELHGDSFGDHDNTANKDGVSGARAGGALLASADLHLAPQLVVTPAARLELLSTAPTPDPVDPSAMQPPSRWDVIASPRFSALFAATPDVSVKGSIGRYARLPTLLEVFGNRGFILGTPGLLPETGPSTDLGVVWSPARVEGGEVDRVLVQGDVFANRAHDTIAFITTVGLITRAENIGDTQSYGGELMASARFARLVTVTASYTRLVTEQMSMDANVDGKPVPRRPGHVAYGRAEAAHVILARAASAYLDAAYQSESFLDPASLGRTPARLLLGAGARVEVVPRLGLALSVANLADARIAHLPLDPPPSPTLTATPTPLTDVAGFPLPGRAFYLSLDWTH